MNLATYKTFLFDCDGVILNSNIIKSNAFYQTALPFGEDAAKKFLQYHVQNGGISRYEKFEYFHDVIVPKYNKNIVKITTSELLDAYATQVKKELMCCEIASGLAQLRAIVPDAKWCIVSGGDQEELRAVLNTRKIGSMFNGGIFGSPDNKFEILERELKNSNIKSPALFLGDSKLDHQAAATFEIDFVFLSKWTEFHNWKTYCHENNLKTVSSIHCLLESF